MSGVGRTSSFPGFMPAEKVDTKSLIEEVEKHANTSTESVSTLIKNAASAEQLGSRILDDRLEPVDEHATLKKERKSVRRLTGQALSLITPTKASCETSVKTDKEKRKIDKKEKALVKKSLSATALETPSERQHESERHSSSPSILRKSSSTSYGKMNDNTRHLHSPKK